MLLGYFAKTIHVLHVVYWFLSHCLCYNFIGLQLSVTSLNECVFSNVNLLLFRWFGSVILLGYFGKTV